MGVVRGDDVGHLAATRFAPGCPEIDEHGTTRVIGQARRAAGESLQGEIGRGRSQRLGREPTCGGEKRRERDREELRTEPHLGPLRQDAEFPDWELGVSRVASNWATATWCSRAGASSRRRSERRRSEEHTSELQSHSDLVCRLLLEKKNR